jgi:hypothetical protein
MNDGLGGERNVAVGGGSANRTCARTDEAADEGAFAATCDSADQGSAACASADHGSGSLAFTR